MVKLNLIITTYNHDDKFKYFENWLVKKHFFFDKIFICDDCSSNNFYIKLISLKKKIKKKLKIYRLKENSGRPALPRNLILKKTKNKFIMFLDFLDFPTDRYLHNIHELLKKKENKKYIMTGIKFTFKDFCLVFDKKYNFKIKRKNFYYLSKNFLKYKNIITLSGSVIYNNTKIRFKNRYLEDWSFFKNLNRNIILIPDHIFYYSKLTLSPKKNIQLLRVFFYLNKNINRFILYLLFALIKFLIEKLYKIKFFYQYIKND